MTSSPMRGLMMLPCATSSCWARQRGIYPATCAKHIRKIEWRRIVGARNGLAHGYLGIDVDVVWDIVQTDVPALLPKLKLLLESTE